MCQHNWNIVCENHGYVTVQCDYCDETDEYTDEDFKAWNVSDEVPEE